MSGNRRLRSADDFVPAAFLSLIEPEPEPGWREEADCRAPTTRRLGEEEPLRGGTVGGTSSGVDGPCGAAFPLLLLFEECIRAAGERQKLVSGRVSEHQATRWQLEPSGEGT